MPALENFLADHGLLRSNAGQIVKAEFAARRFRTVTNFIAIAYLRMAKLKHLPDNRLRAAVPREFGVTRYAA
jgi:transposase